MQLKSSQIVHHIYGLAKSIGHRLGLVENTINALHQAESSRVRQDVNHVAFEILGSRINQLEVSIKTLSQGISSLTELRDQVWAIPLQQESTELVDTVKSLAASADNTTASITIDNSTRTSLSTNGSIISNASRQASDVISERSEPHIGCGSSLHGFPLDRRICDRINSWMSNISSITPSDNLSQSISRFSISSESASSEYASTVLTAPSTVRNLPDLQAEIIQRRYKHGLQRMSEKKYVDAIAHLERTMEQFTSQSIPLHVLGQNVSFLSIQYNLAKALIKAKIKARELEKFLNEIPGPDPQLAIARILMQENTNPNSLESLLNKVYTTRTMLHCFKRQKRHIFWHVIFYIAKTTNY